MSRAPTSCSTRRRIPSRFPRRGPPRASGPPWTRSSTGGTRSRTSGSDLGGQELREREDFVIEATHLLKDRLIGTPVFERLGWDTDVWVPWMTNTAFQRGFRQMMFSKIVPNLKRLGLLTPRVREAFEKLDILRFEHDKDSVEEPGVTPPAELVQMILEYMANRAPTAE